MKKIIYLIFVWYFLASLIAPVSILAAKPKANAKAATAEEANQSKRMTNLKSRAYKEIDRRVAALNKVVAKISSITKLSAEQKTIIATDIQENITSLKALKTKIEADTDLEVLKTDVKSIIDSYCIYALYIPKIHMLEATDISDTVITKLNELATKLETRLGEAKTAGQDVTALQADLVEMKAKISDAQKQVNDAAAALVSLSPTGYPDNKATMESVRAMLKTARGDLVTAKQDAKKIIDALKTMDTTKAED